MNNLIEERAVEQRDEADEVHSLRWRPSPLISVLDGREGRTGA
jgi:hypothetical protein